jgi:hypothetical protein
VVSCASAPAFADTVYPLVLRLNIFSTSLTAVAPTQFTSCCAAYYSCSSLERWSLAEPFELPTVKIGCLECTLQTQLDLTGGASSIPLAIHEEPDGEQRHRSEVKEGRAVV